VGVTPAVGDGVGCGGGVAFCVAVGDGVGLDGGVAFGALLGVGGGVAIPTPSGVAAATAPASGVDGLPGGPSVTSDATSPAGGFVAVRDGSRTGATSTGKELASPLAAMRPSTGSSRAMTLPRRTVRTLICTMTASRSTMTLRAARGTTRVADFPLGVGIVRLRWIGVIVAHQAESTR
jgi:hypothetical protein